MFVDSSRNAPPASIVTCLFLAMASLTRSALLAASSASSPPAMPAHHRFIDAMAASFSAVTFAFQIVTSSAASAKLSFRTKPALARSPLASRARPAACTKLS